MSKNLWNVEALCADGSFYSEGPVWTEGKEAAEGTMAILISLPEVVEVFAQEYSADHDTLRTMCLKK
jgi:hypothetical protein